ncbi:hypothetical protein DLAC_09325 [Tieghemostelium lacteum]|uniref:Biogenesis of lysosome-related organelles complex 1 subunit 4 n=1 Tax=Tieghemostelium lacteum TaxID=361077 RepID=A0A151Z9Q5_TIELA|nr:hypothetical protein DLAC_09325 [Tieghemostelium lacteum]|eukprot:KYQ90690.1 hypothetical protein DLAC_09325 [Tieghemostelium lacteum]
MEDDDILDNQELLKGISQQYANYLSFSNSTNEQARNIDEITEYMLARIDEFGAFLETIKTDTDKTEKKLIPLLLEKSYQVQQLFPLIDKLQLLTIDISKNLNTLENRLNQADKHVSQLQGPSNPFKWVLSRVGSKEDDNIIQQLRNQPPPVKFEPINIHNTSEFFKHLRNEMQQVSINNPSTKLMYLDADQKLQPINTEDNDSEKQK